MDNEIRELIDAFKGYRDLLTPIQNNLHEFAETYNSLKGDINTLNSAFEGDVQGKLQSIYETLAGQARKATDLSSRIDSFITSSERYIKGVESTLNLFGKVTDKITAINEIEKKAEDQIGKLDAVIEEKKKSYNLKELEKTLDSYNNNVARVSEFINEDVAKSLQNNSNEIAGIRRGNEDVIKILADQNSTLDKLVLTYTATNDLLKNVVEREDVNESYIFAILDKWAENRKIKIKK